MSFPLTRAPGEKLEVHGFLQMLKRELTPDARKLLKAELKKALAATPSDQLLKDVTGSAGVTTGAGLVPASLESPAAYLFPVVAILRNQIARRVVGGTARNFKQITGITHPARYGFCAEATSSTTGRSGYVTLNEKDRTVAFKKLGTDSFVTMEAEWQMRNDLGEDFEPLELAVLMNLYGTIIAEERAILGARNANFTPASIGTASKTFSASGEPAISQPATGLGSLTAATNYYVKISVLSNEGFLGSATGRVSGVDSYGESLPAAEVTITTATGGSAGDKAFTLGWTHIPGAVAYNVFVGTAPGTNYYQKTVYKNRATIGLDDNGASQALNGSGPTPNQSELSGDTNAWDGLITQIAAFSSLNAYVKNLGGATLTGDSTSGVSQFDDAFQSMFRTSLIGPDIVLMNAKDRKSADGVIAGSSGPVFRIQASDGQSNLTGAVSANGMLNRYTNKVVQFVTHPHLPQGTAIGFAWNLNEYFPAANLPATLEMLLAFDYIKQDYALVANKREMGVYLSGSPAVRVPFATMIIQGIG